MRLVRLYSFAACLALLGAAHAADIGGAYESPDDKPDADRRSAEPPKTGSSVPSEGSEARNADKEAKRRSTPGFRIKLPAETE